MKYNYPVKYCAMPVETNDWFNSKNYINAFIVSKCYVINEIISYSIDGTKEINYKVVFPYQKIIYTDNDYERVYPQFDSYGNLKNGVLTKCLFDSKEEAENYVESLNKSFNSTNSTLAYQDEKNSYIDLDAYKILENNIELLTNDMIVNNSAVKNEIIFCSKEENKILEISLYDFISYYKNMDFYVCSVDDKIINEIKLDISNKKWFKKYTANHFKPLLFANNGNIKIANNSNDCGSYYLDQNEKLNYSKKIPSFVNDARFMRNDDMLKIYSTETFDDIINSYKNKESILEERDLVKKLKYN